MYWCTSGNLGSGKSTLALLISDTFRIEYVPKEKYPLSYIESMFSGTDRWVFESQAAFMLHKAKHIRIGLEAGPSIVVDRSLAEEMFVFVKHFYLEGRLDERSYNTLYSLYQELKFKLPEPEVYIYCECSASTWGRRANKRNKNYEEKYPELHFLKLEEKLFEWRDAENRRNANIVYWNAEEYDIFDMSIRNMLIKDLEKLSINREFRDFCLLTSGPSLL